MEDAEGVETVKINEVPETGRGSFGEIAAYVATVIEQRTTVGPDTTAAKLASGITHSILNRLRDTSARATRVDELEAQYARGYVDASEKYGEVGSLRDAVDECLSRLADAVERLRA